MQDTQAQAMDADDEINLLDLVQTVVDNLRLLVLGPLAVGVAALGISFLVTPTFTAQVSFLPPQQSQGMAASLLNSLGALGGLAGSAAGIKNPNDQYVSFLKSNSIEDALIDRFKLMDRYKADYKQDARKTLEGSVKIASGKDGIITVSVDDHDPQFAADLANAHVEELTRLMGRLAVTEAQQRRQFFEQQLKTAKDKLAVAEIALGETGVNAAVLKSNPASAVAAVATLQAQVTAQEVKLGAMRGYLAESAPEFKQAMTELLNLRAQLAKQSQDKGWHLYVIRLSPDAHIDRDAVIQGLSGRGIGSSVHYVPLHRQPYWRDRYGLTPAMFPQAEQAYQTMLSIPLFTAMSDDDQARVIAALRELLG